MSVGGAMPSAFVTVADYVWHAALRELDPKPIWPDRQDFGPDSACEYPRRLVEEVVAYLSEDLMCDHAVNICMCGAIEVVRELTLNLAGQETCRACGGEGFVWDQAAYDKAKAERDADAQKAKTGLIEWRDELWWDIADSAGYQPCLRCNKKGVIDQ